MNFPFSDLLPVGVCSFSFVSDGLLECRAKERLPRNAKSVIVYLFPYYLGEEYYRNINISKYAVPEDYHNIAGKYLEKAVTELKNTFPDNEFVSFCDNSPIDEVKAAALCGLGVSGENSLLINETYGSFVFIGEIVTDKEFNYENNQIKHCLKCGLCKKVCPGKAVNGGKIEKEKCFSHLTQKKTVREKELDFYIKKTGCIWGCDICQDVCPLNKNIKKTPVKEFYENAKSVYLHGDDIKMRAFAWRKQSVIERNLSILYCNSDNNKV